MSTPNTFAQRLLRYLLHPARLDFSDNCFVLTDTLGSINAKECMILAKALGNDRSKLPTACAQYLDHVDSQSKAWEGASFKNLQQCCEALRCIPTVEAIVVRT